MDRLEFSGGSIPLRLEVTTLGTGAAEFDISRSGDDVAYVPEGAAMPETTTLAWQDRNGEVSPIEMERSRLMIYPRLSPDDSKVAVDIRGGETDIWVWISARTHLLE